MNLKSRFASTLALVLMAAPLFAGAAPVTASPPGSPALDNPFAHAAFERTWARTDRPVASGLVQRSWYWGPQPNTGGLLEDYAEGAGGKRLVQYFDKSRMEINDPNADQSNPFFVTNGLLTVELISGRMQVGNNAYVARTPANIPLASDTDDPNAPTYVSFQGVSNTTLGDHFAPNRIGQKATATINKAGVVGNDPAVGNYPGIEFAYYDPTTKHNVPKVFWDFLNLSGPTWDSSGGQYVNARLSDPWFYTTGLPISEPYWAKVKIANVPNVDVMIQAFERRVVTYVPSIQGGFQVQMSNIGQHYYDWRYPSNPPQPTVTPTTTQPIATATPVQPTATAVQPTATVPPTNTPPVSHPATTQVVKQVTVPAHSTGSAIAACPAGSIVSGGGWASNSAGTLDVYNSSRSGNGWQVYATNTSNANQLLNSYAICLSGSGGSVTQEVAQKPIAGGAHDGVNKPCSSGVLTGGGFAKNTGLALYNTSPQGNGWESYAFNTTAGNLLLNTYAMCLSGVNGASSSLVVTQVPVGAHAIGTALATCPAGRLVTGGGFAAADGLLLYTMSADGNGWRVYGKNNTAGSVLLNSYAQCTLVP